MSDSTKAVKPQILALKSTHADFKPNIQRPLNNHDDVLVENLPYGRVYHLVVADEQGKPQYDIAAMAEPMGAICLALRNTYDSPQCALLRHWRAVPATDPRTHSHLTPNLSKHGTYMLETPRGFPEKGESCVDAAMREVAEEVGLPSVKAIQIGTINANSAFMMSDIPLCVVLVESSVEDKQTQHQTDPHEFINSVRWIPLTDIAQTIASGQIRCGLTLAALAHLMAATGRIEQFLM